METKTITVIGENIRISDGYHTFDELYDHRCVLYIKLCKMLEILELSAGPEDKGTLKVWKSFKHSDGSSWKGWFILGLNLPDGTQITYHIPEKYWSLASDVGECLEHSADFDGHSSDDVLQRLMRL